LTFVFLQMPNFRKREEELETDEDRWLYLLRYLPDFTNRPAALQERIFDRLFHLAEISTLSKAEQEAYDDSLKAFRDMGNVLDKAFMDGKEEAKLELTPLLEEAQREKEEAQREKEEALREKEEARQREEEERRQKEEVLNRLRGTARQLLAKGFSAEEVAGVMGISTEDVKRLA
jgi:hypothetical protein